MKTISYANQPVSGEARVAISTLFRVPDQHVDEILAGGKGDRTPDQSDLLVEEDQDLNLSKVEEESLERVKDQVASLGWDELRELVAGLLRDMVTKPGFLHWDPIAGRTLSPPQMVLALIARESWSR